MGGLTKADILSRVSVAADFGQRSVFQANDLDQWPGKMLILEAGNDPCYSSTARNALHTLYPRADVHQFQGTGHITAILKPDEYVSVLCHFLADGV